MKDRTQNFLDPKQLCNLLNIKMSRLRTAIFRKEIPVIRIGRCCRFDPNDIEKWIEQNKTKDETAMN